MQLMIFNAIIFDAEPFINDVASHIKLIKKNNLFNLIRFIFTLETMNPYHIRGILQKLNASQ